MQDKQKLLMVADRLYTLGLQVEAEREYLKSLVMAGVSYESEEMLKAVQDYQKLDAE